MNTNNKESNIVQKLNGIYQEKGFVSEDTVLNEIIEAGLSLDKIDYICDKLLSSGIIISETELHEEDNNKEDEYDRSQIDYEQVFKLAIGIEGRLKQFIYEIRQIKAPQHREVQNLMPQAKNGNLFAQERIISMYLKIAVKLALWHYKKYKLPLEEAIQDGCVGIIIALDKFDITRQEGFSTYAPWWIRQNISRQASPPNADMYFPVHVKEKIFSVYAMAQQYGFKDYKDIHRDVEFMSDVSKKLDYSLKEVEEYIHYFSQVDSLEELVSKDEIIFSDYGFVEQNIIEKCSKRELRDTIEYALDTLKDKEKKVLKLRFGLVDGIEHTLEEVGKQFNVTRERIRQIEAKGLRKLRRGSMSEKIRSFL